MKIAKRIIKYHLGRNIDAIAELTDKLYDQQINYTSYTGYGKNVPSVIKIQLDNLTSDEIEEINAAVNWTHE